MSKKNNTKVSNTSSDDDAIIYWVVGIVVFIAIASYFHLFSFIWYKVRLFQFHLLNYMPITSFKEAYSWLNGQSYKQLSSYDMNSFDALNVTKVSWIYGIAIFALGWIILKKSRKNITKSNYRKVGLKESAEILSKKFPWIKTLISDNPLKKPMRYRSGKDNTYSNNLTPVQFLTIKPSPLILNKTPIYNEKTHYLDEDLLKKEFSAQLDNKTKSKGRLKIVYSKINGRKILNITKTLNALSEVEKKFYDYLLDGIEDKYVKNKFERVKIDANYINIKFEAVKMVDGKLVACSPKECKAGEFILQHRYTRTFLMSLYEYSMQFGFESLVRIPWLAKEDRVLQLCMASIGREECFAEVVGCFSHWQAEKYAYIEKISLQGLSKPFFDAGIETFKNYLTKLSGMKL